MLKKRDIVRSTKELYSMLGNTEVPEDGDIILRSENYLQLVIPILFRTISKSHKGSYYPKYVLYLVCHFQLRVRTDTSVSFRAVIFEK